MSFVNYNRYSLEFALKCVGERQHPLLMEVFEKKESLGNLFKIIQVKEKFGKLRIYTDCINDELRHFLSDIENRSGKICEVCGNPGKLRSGGWLLTLCEDHANDRPAIDDSEF